MCHHGFDSGEWHREEEETEETPEFLNEEGDTEVELVTDGGDESATHE